MSLGNSIGVRPVQHAPKVPEHRSRVVAAVGWACAVLALAGASSCSSNRRRRGSRTDRDASATSAPLSSVPRVPWSVADRTQALTTGRAAITRHQCHRCHDVDDIPPAGRSDHCVNCHQWLRGLTAGSRQWTTLVSRYGEDVIRRYQRNIQHYLQVPTLTRIGLRIEPAWIDRYIAEPWDLRPAMHETMIRTHISPDDRRAIVRYFAAVAEVRDPYARDASPAQSPATSRRPSPSAAILPSRIEAGRALFQSRACSNCHTFGNIATGRTPEDLARAGPSAALATNLRFVRDRMHREVIVDWLLAPQAFVANTLMPPTGLTRDQAELIRDFLIAADPVVLPMPATPSANVNAPQPAALQRAVGWEEVKTEVLGHVCVHCHMNDHERDTGPGNRGGYGWPGSQLRVRTYEMLVSGAVGRDGARYSVLVQRAGESVAPIVQAMLRRRAEELRDHVAPFDDHLRPPYPDAPPGMPMGLPSMSDAQIALVTTWISQGCRGPTGVTGMPGIRDGYLVPDGPIEQNHGCELRMPSERRPAWSSQSERP